YQEKIRQAPHPKTARKLGRSRFKRIRSDWSNVKEVIMTRGVYIKCRSHENIADELMATAPHKIMENSQYDYFWGCGRDRRGTNTYGKVLMNVRAKLIAERDAQ
ncbi:MAG: NADAR family protein, partial [Cellvibrionales bacterium]|nr:NADAR family protein [Cellvibrionales bacterium]